MFDRIVVPVDGSRPAERAVRVASALARAFAGQLHLVRVVEPGRAGGLSLDSVEWRLQRAEAERYLEALAERLRVDGVEAACETREGRPAEQIVCAAGEREADLIVLCTSGRGDGRPVLGGTVHRVLAAARSSVLLLRGRVLLSDAEDVGPARIMVPVDCSPRADWALRVAASLARRTGAELIVAHVNPLPDMPRWLPRRQREMALQQAFVRVNRRAATRYLEDTLRGLVASDLSVRTVMETSGQVARTLHRIAVQNHVDLVVLCAHGVSGPSPWPFGGVAGSLIVHGDLPLLVLRDGASGRRRSTVAATAAETGLPADADAVLNGADG